MFNYFSCFPKRHLITRARKRITSNISILLVTSLYIHPMPMLWCNVHCNITTLKLCALYSHNTVQISLFLLIAVLSSSQSFSSPYPPSKTHFPTHTPADFITMPHPLTTSRATTFSSPLLILSTIYFYKFACYFIYLHNNSKKI